jgi:hypothetical protein
LLKLKTEKYIGVIRPISDLIMVVLIKALFKVPKFIVQVKKSGNFGFSSGWA